YLVSDRRKRDGLLRLSDDVWQKGWWDGYEPDVERQFVDFVWLEARATEIRTFDALVVTGLLQTREYAEAVITAADWEAEPAQVARWVQLRMDRQVVLHREAPPRLRVIIDEFVLRRQIGGPEVLRNQLAHLLATVELPHVDLRVLPASIGAHAGHSGYFLVFTIAEPDMDVGFAETVGGAVYVEPPDSWRGSVMTHAGQVLGPDARADVAWRSSSYSPNNGGSCVEAGALADYTGRIAVRHSHHPNGLALAFAQPIWATFIGSIKNDEFDPRD
ncbi:MAG: DUF397 domain-containing protein, partial [Pseudonocardiaceae bacterium]